MGLVDTLATPPERARKGPQCLACRLLDTLPDVAPEGEVSELAAYKAALDNPAWEASPLAAALRAEGYDVSDYGLQRHRRKQCAGTRG